MSFLKCINSRYCRAMLALGAFGIGIKVYRFMVAILRRRIGSFQPRPVCALFHIRTKKPLEEGLSAKTYRAGDEARLSVCLRRRYVIKPTPAKPSIIIAHVDGSGTAAVILAIVMLSKPLSVSESRFIKAIVVDALDAVKNTENWVHSCVFPVPTGVVKTPRELPFTSTLTLLVVPNGPPGLKTVPR